VHQVLVQKSKYAPLTINSLLVNYHLVLDYFKNSIKLQNWIQQQVEYMGGFFMKQLRSSVTHLVADSVMSAKYEVSLYFQYSCFFE